MWPNMLKYGQNMPKYGQNMLKYGQNMLRYGQTGKTGPEQGTQGLEQVPGVQIQCPAPRSSVRPQCPAVFSLGPEVLSVRLALLLSGSPQCPTSLNGRLGSVLSVRHVLSVQLVLSVRHGRRH